MAFVHVDSVAVEAYVHHPEGDIYKDLRRRGRRVTSYARRNVGVDTGGMRSTIHMVNHYGLKFPEVAIIADHPRAYMHHEGTRPHVITPERGRYLRFKIAGKIVYAEKVNHPGTKANPFLRRGLLMARD